MDNNGDNSNDVKQGVFGPPNQVYRHQISAVCDKLSRQDIDEIVKNFDLEYLDPPVCVDHFEEGSLKRWGSLGSILSVKADGDKLYADISETPMLTEMRERGIVKGWSIGGDRTEKGCQLVHLSGCATRPPYVKGIKKMPLRLLNDLKKPDFMVRLEDTEISAQTSAKEVKVDENTKAKSTMPTDAAEALVKTAVSEARREWEIKLEDNRKEFQVKLNESTGQVKELEVQLEDARKEATEWKAKARTASRQAEIDGLFGERKITPAEKKYAEESLLNLEDDKVFDGWIGVNKERNPVLEMGATPGLSGKTKEAVKADRDSKKMLTLEEFKGSDWDVAFSDFPDKDTVEKRYSFYKESFTEED